MNVYLFELDSVRNSEQEIAIGQNALFYEIVANGNTVVLTHNQLSDSAAFWAGLNSEDSYQAIMELSRLGLIQVSLFAQQRTAAQYILQHINGCIRQLESLRRQENGENTVFYFSLIPLSADEGELLEELYRAIQYSDVQLLREKADSDIRLSDKYRFLYRYVELILMLSRSETANRPQKQGTLKTILDYYEQTTQMFPAPEATSKTDALIARGVGVLQSVSVGMGRAELMRRSVWYQLLETQPLSEDVCAAEAVIDLCYNYALEDSISEISKRYEDGNPESFRTQFRLDMAKYWDSAVNGAHVFHRQDETRKNAQLRFSGVSELPAWSMGLNLVRRNVEYARKRGEYSAPEVSGKTRARQLTAQKQHWKGLTNKSLRYSLALAAMYAVSFVFLSYALDAVQDALTGSLAVNAGFAGKLIFQFLSIVLFGLVSSSLFARFRLPDILETVLSIKQGIRERRMLIQLEKQQNAGQGGTRDAIS